MLDPILLSIAKSSILSYFDTKMSIDKKQLIQIYPFLSSQGATFVTLHYDGNLRGCIGSIIAHTSLLEDILHNSISAAFKDSRFKPLTEDELTHLSLEVSLLSEPTIIEYESFDDLLTKIEPNLDGLILQHGIHRGTFLPQVWEQLPTPKEFLKHLSIKAGASIEIYNQHPQIYRYRVDAIEKKFNDIKPL